MICTITCHHCGEEVPQNPRIKNQKYCPAKECQECRRLSWKREQYNENKRYREKSRVRGEKWREDYPGNKYQKDYRDAHPEYVNRNREQQRIRNKKRQKEQVTMIVKTDSLLLQPREDGAYTLSKIKKNMIVKRNALMRQSSNNGDKR